MKGIPKKCIENEAKARGIREVDIYQLLFDGYTIAFNLAKAKAVIMKKKSCTHYENMADGDVGTVRTISFMSKEEKLAYEKVKKEVFNCKTTKDIVDHLDEINYYIHETAVIDTDDMEEIVE